MDVKRDKSVKRKMTMRENEKGERGKQLVRGKPVKEKIVRGKRGGMRGNQESEKGMEMAMANDERNEGKKPAEQREREREREADKGNDRGQGMEIVQGNDQEKGNETEAEMGSDGEEEIEVGMQLEMDQRSEGRKKRTKRGMGIDQGACQEKEIDQETRDREMLEEAKDQVTEVCLEKET